MSYRINITWRVCATSHHKEELVVDDLADIGRTIVDDAPAVWDAAYVVIVGTTAAPQPAKLIEAEAA